VPAIGVIGPRVGAGSVAGGGEPTGNTNKLT